MNSLLQSSHVQRWITGIVSAPLLIVLIYYSSVHVFSLFILAVVLIAAGEYNRLLFHQEDLSWEKGQVFFFSGVITISAYISNNSMMAASLTCCVLLSFICVLLQNRKQAIDMARVGKVILGFMYIPLLISSFILLRHLPQGISWVFFTLVLAFCGDTFGYYVGKTLGKRKLCPALSPGKTVAGTVGLICGSLLGSIIFQQLIFTELSLRHALIMGIMGGIFGQLGDLFESALKRSAGVKDAGSLFPGHGGILDRLDSLSFIAPFVFYYHDFVIQ